MVATSSPSAELSSIATALADLTRRVTAIAEAAQGTDRDWLAGSLFEAERRLLDASRRISSSVSSLAAE